jgi:histone H3/H4
MADTTLKTKEQMDYASAEEAEESIHDAVDEETADVEADVVNDDEESDGEDNDIVTEGVVEEDVEEDEDDDDEDGEDEDDGAVSVRSVNTEADATSIASGKTDGTPDAKPKAHKAATGDTGSTAKRQGRTPSVTGLTIPFRTVKKAMKLDPDIPIVQNEAAIMTTIAVELFLKRLAKESFKNAKIRGRNTVRYEDVAEARTRNPALAFLEPLLP